MAQLNDSSWFQHFEQQRRQKRIIRQFAVALAQSIQLNLMAHDIVLAAALDQPLHLDNKEALEHWSAERLHAEGLEADHHALVRLTQQLKAQLQEKIA